jgi:hypothetical protein
MNIQSKTVRQGRLLRLLLPGGFSHFGQPFPRPAKGLSIKFGKNVSFRPRIVRKAKCAAVCVVALLALFPAARAQNSVTVAWDVVTNSSIAAWIPGAQAQLKCVGQIGHTYNVLATPDFKMWTILRTMTTDNPGVFVLIDSSAPGYSSRFYRLRDTTQ